MPDVSDIATVNFQPPDEARLPVEVMTIADLKTRAPSEHFRRLQRANFYRLFGVLQGQTRPMIDFSNVVAEAGKWLLVRPAQVFRYDFSTPWTGWLMVFPPEVVSGTYKTHLELDLARCLDDLAAIHDLQPDQHTWMCGSLNQMRADATAVADTFMRNDLLRAQLATSLLRLSLWQSTRQPDTPDRSGESASFRRFRQLLEANFHVQHSAQFYARSMAMSDKTLSRVCLAATGQPAKKVINQRLTLEAKRLLAHTSVAVQAVSHTLGFDEATNFVKFFRRETGVTPLLFRRQYR
ncbi:MAG TPA: AraC family transcriptional regulator [Burkholderiaceae bacterium]|nr:AraC family transcriptional regulator [Burkholderiaceae bacterium]